MEAEYYDFTEVEPDFSIHYNIKYSMGDELRKTTRYQVPLFDWCFYRLFLLFLHQLARVRCETDIVA